jgi:hypothetical protein
VLTTALTKTKQALKGMVCVLMIVLMRTSPRQRCVRGARQLTAATFRGTAVVLHARCSVPLRYRIYKVGQNHIYTVYIRYFWQGNHKIYGHIRCIYTVLANPTHILRYRCCA